MFARNVCPKCLPEMFARNEQILRCETYMAKFGAFARVCARLRAFAREREQLMFARNVCPKCLPEMFARNVCPKCLPEMFARNVCPKCLKAGGQATPPPTQVTKQFWPADCSFVATCTQGPADAHWPPTFTQAVKAGRQTTLPAKQQRSNEF